MADRQFSIVKSDVLSTPYQTRWVIANAKTGEVLDDAQGCGYRSPETADAALWFRFRTPARMADDLDKYGIEGGKQNVREKG